MTKYLHRALVALAALAALVAVVGAGAGTTRGPQLSLRWQAPTPHDGTAYAVKAGETLSFDLRAGSRIKSRGLPAGVSFGRAGGHASVTWTPTRAQVGEHLLTFVASSGSSYAPPRSFIVYVLPDGPAGPHEPFPLGGVNGMSRWAEVYLDVSARTRPSGRAKSIVRLHQYTPEGTPNLVQALGGQINTNGEYWVRVRLPLLPNGKTGWVPRASLGPYNEIWTHLVIDRKLFTATLYKKGRAIFRTRVGVGKPYWPTPAGEFYVRERITGFSDPIYGPAGLRNERALVRADRLARRRLHRDPRHEPAGDPSRPRVPRLRAHAELRRPAAVAPHVVGHPCNNPLTPGYDVPASGAGGTRRLDFLDAHTQARSGDRCGRHGCGLARAWSG